IENNRLQTRPRLVDGLKVESGWEQAVETVLGEHLQALCVEDLTQLSAALADFSEGRITLRDSAAWLAPGGTASPALAGRELSARIVSSQSLVSQLQGVFVADNLAEGLALRQHLAAGESIITREGVWLGPDWL